MDESSLLSLNIGCYQLLACNEGEVTSRFTVFLFVSNCVFTLSVGLLSIWCHVKQKFYF